MVTKPTRPGLQPERTSMSWLRTSLALVLNALLILRFGLFYSHFAALLLALTVVICLSYLYVHVVRARKHRTYPERKYHTPRHEAMVISFLTVVIGIFVMI